MPTTPQVAIAEIQREYPNNGFGTYWGELKKESSFKSRWWKNVYAFFELTRQIIKDAGIELSFLLIFWAIITQMSQGRDIIVSMFEPDNIYTRWRIFYTVASAFSPSLAMWMVPVFLFQIRDRINHKRPGYQPVLKRHLYFAHRVLPMVPFWLLAAALFNGKWMTWLFTGISILVICLLFLFNKYVKDGRKRLWFAIATGALLLGFIIYFNSIFEKTYTEAKIVLTIILYLISMLLHYVFHEADVKVLRKHKTFAGDYKRPYWRFKGNSIVYTIVFCIHVFLGIVLFTDYRDRLHIAPESIMLYIFSLYVFIIDLVVYLINMKPQGKLIAALVLIIIAASFYYCPKINFNVSHYTLDSYSDSKKGDKGILDGRGRLTFEERYKKLKTKVDSNNTGIPYPIILISGEGGGSRAGFWFSQNLINFDYYTNGKFREHIFSISTVSGSSVGLSSVFTFWELTENKMVDSAWLDFPLEIYSNNFVGSSVKGMLLTDVWKSIIPVGKFKTDRNSLLQDEESYYTQLAARRILKESTGNKEPNIPTSERILCRDFMNFFYDTINGKLDFTNRPLVFINSCRSNDGRRSIVSPIKLTDSVFNDAVDIAGFTYEDETCKHKDKEKCATHKRTISLGQACNLSELFPGFSAPAYINSLGSFVDGGYHENSGLKTTLDVYTNLKEALSIDPPAKPYAIYIIYLKNGSGEKNLYKQTKSELPITLPLKALTSQPFEGSASYFEEKARYVNGLRFYSIRLNNELIKDKNDNTATEDSAMREIEKQILNDLRTEPTDSSLKFPLARWLSKSVIKRMRLATFPVKVNPTEDDARVHCLLKRINDINEVTPVPLSPFWRWSPMGKELLAKQDSICEFNSRGKLTMVIRSPQDTMLPKNKIQQEGRELYPKQ